jgi:hypothetical protein
VLNLSINLSCEVEMIDELDQRLMQELKRGASRDIQIWYIGRPDVGAGGAENGAAGG